MGLSVSTQQKKTFVNIVGGKFAIRAKEGDEGAVSRKNKNQELVWERIYDSLTGIIVDVKVERVEALKAYNYIIEVNDVGDVYYVNIPVDSRYGDSLAMKLPKIEKNGVYTLVPYDFPAGGRKNIGIAVYEGTEMVKGQGLKPFYTKEEPNGMPFPKRELDEDEYKAYSLTKRKFLKDEVAKWGKEIKPNAPKVDDDDLPF